MTITTFSGRVALVTGGGRNLGRAIIMGFASAGVDVAVNVRSSADELEEVVAQARAASVRAFGVLADVGDPEQCAQMIDQVTADLGPVDYLVNNAAARPLQHFLDITPEDWNRVIASNLSSAFFLSRLVLGGMAERHFGRIINIGGPDGQLGYPDRAHNVTAKAGIVGLTKAIAVEFGAKGVTANVVVPGIMNTSRDLADYPNWPPGADVLTERLAIPRLGEADELADACLFIASDQAAYVTGQTLHVSGGMVKP